LAGCDSTPVPFRSRKVALKGPTLKIPVLLLLLLCSPGLQARFLWWGQSASLPAKLVDSLLAVAGDTLQLRLSICEAGSGRSLLERDSRIPVAPASLCKILTSVTALDRLGSGYRFETRVGFRPDALGRGVLSDTLFWFCGGNPDLQGRDLRRLVADLRQAGVDSLAGPLVVYSSRYDARRLGPGWSWDDGTGAWSARISAATVNGNGLVRKPGPGLAYEGWPAGSGSPAQAIERDWVRSRDRFFPAASGVAPTSFINVEFPDSLYLRVLQEALASEGLALGPKGVRLSRRPVPRRMWQDAELRLTSAPLETLLGRVLTDSWNLGTECVFQEMVVATDEGESDLLPRSSWEQAAGLQMSHLGEVWGEDLGVRLVDGCGLSRQNGVPLLAFARVMVADEQRQPGRLRTLLARPGTGTLKGRFRDLPAGVGLRGKTGSLRGSQLLAAYLYREPAGRKLADHEPLPGDALVVVIGLDGGLGSAADLKSKQEMAIGMLARWLLEP
jgi:D-alanyl-D-alanine carboxypeptidase/D-alanyl-D-alanine-endopeptidase (penicillin-binding protein 4)